MRSALRFVFLLIASLFIVGTAPAGLFAPGGTEARAETPAPVIGTVYVFRPMGGRLASPEMDNLAAKIRARGLEADVYNYTNWLRPAKDAIARYRAEEWKSPIIVIGHSAGGDSAIRFALWLKRSGVPVNLIVTLDPTRIAGKVPANVERFVNIYSSVNTLGGGDPEPARDYRGHFATVDLKDFSVMHRYLPGIAGLQETVVEKIAAVAERPAAVDGPAIQIAYAIPRGEAIVLWDGGVPVAAAAGDTPASVAAQFGVPAWAIAAINEVDPARPLPAGKRLTVPHHFEADAGQ